MPYVVAVILNWNNYADSAECLRSLRGLRYEDMDIVLVDNGSTDGSGDQLELEFPEIEIIRIDDNIGFGAGNNLGIREALNRGAEYVWVLNNDTLVQNKDLLNGLVDTMESKKEIGVLSPRLMMYPKKNEVWFEKGFIDWRSGNAGHEHFRPWFIDWRFRLDTSDSNQMSPSRKTADNLIYSDYIPFCSVLVRSEIFNNVSLYPERYFLYYGDVDYCVRITRNGYSLAVDPELNMYHKVSSSSGNIRSPMHLYYLARNRLLFYDRFSDRFKSSTYLFYGWWLFVNIIYLLYRGDKKGLQALGFGVLDGIRKEKAKGRYP